MLTILLCFTVYALSFLHAKPLTNHPIPRTFPVLTTVPTTVLRGCEYEGKIYEPYESFAEGNDGEHWCFGQYCDEDGNRIAWDNFNCGSTIIPSTAPPRPTTFLITPTPRKHSTTPKPTTNSLLHKKTSPPTAEEANTPFPPTTNAYTTVPRRLGCEHEGKFYAPGESFGEGTDGEGWCYGYYCDDDGNAIPWDNFNCGSTTTPSTEPARITTFFTTFSRKHSTTPQLKTNPTPPKTAFPPTTPEEATPSPTTNALTSVPRGLGCEHKGKFYAPGESFGEGTDGEGWCYGYYCNDDGNKISWDKFNCGTNTALPTSTFPATTKSKMITLTSTPRNTSPLATFSSPATTKVPFTPIGCMHEGRFYPPGEITQGKEGNWCHGLICDQFGEIIAWDNWNCKSTTFTIPTPFPRLSTLKTTKSTTTTTTHPTTTPRTSTTPPNESTGPTSSFRSPAFQSTLHPTTPPSIGWCFFNGRYFENGDIISRVYHAWSWCSGWYCNDGKVDSWSDFNCPNPSTLQKSTQSTPTPQCYYEGVYYNHGEVVVSGVGSGDCEGLYCSRGVLVQYEDRDCGSAIVTDTTTTVTELPTTKPNPTNTKFDLFATKTDPPIEIATKSFHSRKITNPITQSGATTKLLEPVLCFYEGKYYEEGDIVSRNFDGDNWCSGRYCKGGRLISVDCSDIINSISGNNTSSPKPILPTNTPGPEPPRCFHEKRYYEEGDLVTSGNNWCSGLICRDGVMVLWDNCEVKVKGTNPTITDASKTTNDLLQTQGTTSTNPPTSDLTLTQSIPIPISATKASEPQLCFHEGKYFEEGDIISQDFDGDNWCSGWICRKAQWISVNCSDITSLVSKEGTVSPTPAFPPVTRGPEALQCLHEGRLYEDGDLTTSEDNWCSGLICKNGKMLLWDNCEIKSNRTSQPIADSTLNQSITSVPKANTTLDRKDVTKPSEPPLCFHEGKYYEEGDIVSRNFDGSDWCSGFICREGRLILVNCNDTTSSISKNDTSSPSPFPPVILGPEPSRCYHEGRYYEEGDVATSDNNWCTGFICKDGAMVLWDNCELKVDSTSRPITDISKTTDNELSETTTHASVTDPTTRSTTNPTSTTKITPQTEGTSKPPEPQLCFHDGKYYEEGDITSRDFDGDNWCSGWYCKNGRLIPVDCSDLTSSLTREDILIPKPTLPPVTPIPEPAQCFYEGRYYEEGDLATSDNNWCTGLLCKDGVMVLWDDCKVMPKSTKSSKVAQIPVTTVIPKSTLTPPEVTSSLQSTPKPPKTTLNVFESTRETSASVKVSYETKKSPSKNPYRTKIISYTAQTTPQIITESQDTTTKVPIDTSSIPHASTEILDSTARLPDFSTMTTNIPTRPEQTTPTQPPQTTKPESQKCLYEGKLYPPGEVTKGVLKDGRCYGVICAISGVVMRWESVYCTPTEPPTADIKITLPGCVYNGKYYPPGRISRISNGINAWCLDVICTEEGKIVTANNADCDEPTTTKPTKTAITCLYNGMTYSPGVIKEGADEQGWCYKVVCQDDGQLYLWGDWHCRFSRRPTTTAPPETTPSTPTTCIYDGREYPVGEITRGSDASGWCYGVTCRNDGQIVLWGRFGCRKA